MLRAEDDVTGSKATLGRVGGVVLCGAAQQKADLALGRRGLATPGMSAVAVLGMDGRGEWFFEVETEINTLLAIEIELSGSLGLLQRSVISIGCRYRRASAMRGRQVISPRYSSHVANLSNLPFMHVERASNKPRYDKLSCADFFRYLRLLTSWRLEVLLGEEELEMKLQFHCQFAIN
jgi:hypothetical protein